MKLRMSEFDDDFSEDFAEGSEVITHEYICVLMMSSFQTGHSLLKSIRLKPYTMACLKFSIGILTIEVFYLNTCTATRVKVI